MAENLEKTILSILEDMKGQDIVCLDVRSLTDVMDSVIIVSGTSNRHVKSLAEKVIEKLKQAEQPPLGIEGLDEGEWVLVDCGDVVLHSMLPETRRFYDLERLWSVPAGVVENKGSEERE
ncbi:MAG: ribosome silencing factor, partial [Pseudomonadales bacterium]|nr:ribosome silencing factor [Pseudomonadales bacterium]